MLILEFSVENGESNESWLVTGTSLHHARRRFEVALLYCMLTGAWKTVNTRVRKFFLNRALRSFLKEELRSDQQFEVSLSDGVVTIRDLKLDPTVRIFALY